MKISVIILYTENSKMNDEFPHITVQHELLERNIIFNFNAERCKNAGLQNIPDAENYELIKLRRVYHFNKDTPDSIILTILEPIFLLVDKGIDFNNPHGYLGNRCIVENSTNENENVTNNKGTKRRLNSNSTIEDEIVIEHIPVSLPKKVNRLQTLVRSLETSCNTQEDEIVNNSVTSEDTYSNNCDALGTSKVMSNLTFKVNPLDCANNMCNEHNKNNQIEGAISDESQSNKNVATCNNETTKIDFEILDELTINEIIIDDRNVMNCHENILPQRNIENPYTSNQTVSEHISQSKQAGDFQPYINSFLEEHSYNARILLECDDREKMSKSINDTKINTDETTPMELPEACKIENTSLFKHAENCSIQSLASKERLSNNNSTFVGDNYIKLEFNNEDAEIFNGKNEHCIQNPYIEQNNNKTKMLLDSTPENTSTNVNLSDQDLNVNETYTKRFKIGDSDFMGFTKEEQDKDLVNIYQFYNKKIENLREEIENNIYTTQSFENVDLHKCSTCNFKVEKLSHLQMHIRSHIEPYWCNMCLDMFSSAAKLQDHVKHCHEIGKRSKKLIKEDNNSCRGVIGEKPFKSSSAVKTEIYKCGYCNYSSAYIKRLRYHMRVHEKERLYYCDRCDFTTLAEWIMECHMDAHDTEQHECTECGYISLYKEELSLHMQIHKKEKKFKCDQCSFSTSHLGYFNAHSSFHRLRVESEAETVNRKNRKLYRCEKCDYFTKQQRMLYRHDKKMHSDNKAVIRALVLPDSEAKLHMCMKCGFWAQTQNAFMEHLTIHEDEKPFKCHACDFITNNECDLDIHSKNHFEQECFRCAICNCKFLTMKELENHSKDCSHIADSTKIKLSSVGENT